MLFLCFLLSFALKAQDKYRIVIMTDMTHDDGNSLIRYLYYAPHFDLEAIVVTPQLPDYHHDDDTPWKKVQSILNAYREEESQLRKHHADFPTYEALNSITKKGRGALPIIWLTEEGKFSGDIAGRVVESSWGKIRFSDWIGEGNTPHGEPKDSEGSEFLQEVFDKDDDRPIFVQMWGGPITFVQALYRYRERRGQQKFEQLLQKLHVYSIHLQDISFDYLIDLDQVKALDCINLGETVSTYEGDRVAPGWFLFDHGHFWKYIKVMSQEEVNGHGPMSDLYDHGGEGDTPSFLYLLSAVLGLNDPLEPTQGSWGSMFRPMGVAFPDNYYSTCTVDDEALNRWIPETRNSFLSRLQWSVKEPDEVNHEPKAVLNKDDSHHIVYLDAKPGAKVQLSAAGSSDPDGDNIAYHWFYYKSAGDYQGEINIDNPGAKTQTILVPEDIGDAKIHIVLEVRDHGSPALVSYKRAVISRGDVK